MWSVQIKSIEQDPVPFIAKVTFEYSHTDGRKQEIVERISDPSAYTRIAKNGVNELERKDAINAFIANPPLGAIDFTPPQQTQDQIDAQVFSQKRQALIQAKQDLDIGLIDQTTYDASLAEVSALKPVSTDMISDKSVN